MPEEQNISDLANTSSKDQSQPTYDREEQDEEQDQCLPQHSIVNFETKTSSEESPCHIREGPVQQVPTSLVCDLADCISVCRKNGGPLALRSTRSQAIQVNIKLARPKPRLIHKAALSTLRRCTGSLVKFPSLSSHVLFLLSPSIAVMKIVDDRKARILA